LAPGAEQVSVFVPTNANEFSISMTVDGEADLVWIETNTRERIVGTDDAAFGRVAGTYDFKGTSFIYSGDDTSSGNNVESVSSDLVTVGTYVSVIAGSDTAVGSVSARWNGISPCGTRSYCQYPPSQNPSKSPTPAPTREPTPSPTGTPTTSPTTGPTREPTDSPTSRPSTMPTDNPVISEPTFGPTTSPTSGPTTSPTYSPTACPEGMIMQEQNYPPCFSTNTQTDFDLAPGATQTSIFVPENAKDFEIIVRATGDANLVWLENDSITASNPEGIAIVGRDDSAYGTSPGTFSYKGMIVTYSGEDTDGDVVESLSSPLVSIGTVVNVVAGDAGSIGTVSTRWNGVSPCGTQQYCIHPPTEQPTSAPTQDPVTSEPSFRPTTSPTSGPTTSPSFEPTPSPTAAPSDMPTPCMEGMMDLVIAQTPCFESQSSRNFGVLEDAVVSIVGVPLNAKEFEATLDLQYGDVDFEITGLSENGEAVCLYGTAPECELNDSGTTSSDMQIIVGESTIYRDSDRRGRTVSIPETYEFVTLRITANADAVGTVYYGWNGVLPCGNDIHMCVFPPTLSPTISQPTPAPTSSPTDNPVTSRPTFRPTTSPTSGPTTSPTYSPTDCEPPMTRVDLNYPPCFRTTSSTDFDLAPDTRQTIIFVPLNAQDFETTLTADGLADLIWVNTDTQEEIIGKPDSLLGNGEGTFEYLGTTFTYSGDDSTSPVTVTLRSDSVTVGSYIVVENNGNGDTTGLVTSTWNGVAPCGSQSYCQMPPTDAPTTSPSSMPTSSPTVPPTFFPTSSRPTPMPTESPTTSRPTDSPTTRPTTMPTLKPTTSIPSFHPTTSPTSGPTPAPTDAPTFSPTDNPSRSPTPCPEPMIRFVQTYPPCFATQSTTSFDLAPGAIQTIIFVPLNANDFTAELTLQTGDADMIWLLTDSDTVIVGTDDAPYQTPGTYTYSDMTFTYSGDDVLPETLESDVVTMLTYLQVQAGDSTAVGTVTVRWNGIQPCGDHDYCAMPPTFGPTTSPSSFPTPSPTASPTRNPTTDSPTRRPTLDPVTSTPTFNPTTDQPSQLPTPRVPLTVTTTPFPTTCDMGEYMERYDRVVEELEDLEDACQMLEDEYSELQDTCNNSPSNSECNQCLIRPKQQFSGSIPAPIVSLGRASAINIPVDLDTGYPDQTVFVAFDGEIYVYRPDLGNNQFQRTCVGSGLEALYCDNSRVVCAGGNVYGTTEEVAAALKVSAESRIDRIHPNCPTGCQSMNGAMVEVFQQQDSDIDVSRICVYSDEYYYIEDDGTYTYTCVGYGLETEVCPAHKMVCVGFEEETGLPTYGWFGEQARAVKMAINGASNVYPTCPGS